MADRHSSQSDHSTTAQTQTRDKSYEATRPSDRKIVQLRTDKLSLSLSLSDGMELSFPPSHSKQASLLYYPTLPYRFRCKPAMSRSALLLLLLLLLSSLVDLASPGISQSVSLSFLVLFTFSQNFSFSARHSTCLYHLYTTLQSAVLCYSLSLPLALTEPPHQTSQVQYTVPDSAFCDRYMQNGVLDYVQQ